MRAFKYSDKQGGRRPAATLGLTLLERRDTPAAPAGLTDLYPLSGAGSPFSNVAGYAETHQPTQSSSATTTLDETGTGAAGTFTLGIKGTAHLSDPITATGTGLTNASGSAAADDTYDILMHGHYVAGTGPGPGSTFTPDDETVTENGSFSRASTGSGVGSFAGLSGTASSLTANGSAAYTWSLSWAGTFSGGALTLQSYSDQRTSTTATKSVYGYSNGNTDGAAYSGTSSAGYTLSGPGNAGTYTTTGTGTSSRLPLGNGTQTWVNTPVNTTTATAVTLSGAPAASSLLGFGWEAETANATGFTFHGTVVQSQSLTETATVRSGGVAVVPTFQSTSHDAESNHTVEDEPSTSAQGGAETYHRDETYSDAVDVTGQGSYGDDTPAGPGPSGVLTAADYHAVETSSAVANNLLTTTGDLIQGTDPDTGASYDIPTNSTVARTGGPTYTTTFDYHDAPAGTTVARSSYTAAGGTTEAVRTWGTDDGVAFDSTNTTVDNPAGGGATITIPGIPVAVTPAMLQGLFPVADRNPPTQFIQVPVHGLPPPPVMGPYSGIYKWYNAEIQRIGNDAQKKVANSQTQVWVMQYLRSAPNGRQGKLTDTFTMPAGATYAEATGNSEAYDKLLKLAKARLDYLSGNLELKPAVLLTGGKITSTVTITYYVTPPTVGQQVGPGTCVVQYKITVSVTGVKAGVPYSETSSVGVAGSLTFQDDNLMTMKLTNP